MTPDELLDGLAEWRNSSELRPKIEEVIRIAVNDALERAAKVAEEDSRWNAARARAEKGTSLGDCHRAAEAWCKRIAAAIRRMKT